MLTWGGPGTQLLKLINLRACFLCMRGGGGDSVVGCLFGVNGGVHA